VPDSRPDAGGTAWSDLARPPLNADAAKRALVRPGGRWSDLQVVEQTESTNADLVAVARDGAATGSVRVAEHQTRGRGRLGRRWQAPPRSGLAVSLLLRPGVPAERWPWLPLLTGVAVAETCRRVAEVDAVVKWPNDVLVDERKLAGVLVERVDTPMGAAAVVGIGLNVSLAEHELPAPTASSLALAGATKLDRAVLLRSLLRTFDALFSVWEAAGGDPAMGQPGLHSSYTRRCVTLGRLVRVDLPDGTAVHGEAVAVDPDGRLVLDTPTGDRMLLGAGDVVHVRPDVPGPRR
jgi:BirA family biotin operon repressor/biotin-[acetyl-CoA-carboxylase] ligase